MIERKYRQLSSCCKYAEKMISAISVSTENYISTENMLPARGGVDTAETVPSSKTFHRYDLGDILLSNIRPYFQKIWFADKVGGCSADVLVLETNESVNNKFLYYVLSDSNFFNYATVTSKGTKMPRGSKSAIMRYLVPDISLDTQKKIADILSAYDDLIENNLARISLLEKMASELYKEWFVRFRFPGHEAAKFVDGVPEGWEMRKISEIGEVVGGGTPSTSNDDYWDGGIPWLTPADLADNKNIYVECGERDISVEGLEKSSTILLPPETVLLSSRAPIGYVALAKNEICTNQGFKSVICDTEKILPIYLYLYFKKNKQLLENYASGSTFAELSAKRVNNIKIPVPNIEIQKQFENILRPIIDETYYLAKKNQNLTKQRDLLLPRLMSGKLSVESLLADTA